MGAQSERPLKVLYVHHTGVFGGASRSVLELISAFPAGTVQPYVVVQQGAVSAMLRQAGVDVIETRGISQFDCTYYGHYRGLRWLILVRELYYLPFTIGALLKARRRWPQFDLVHINDSTQVLCIVLAGRIFRAPLVVHVRAMLAGAAIPRRMRWFGRLLARHASAVIAIDETVRSSLPSGIDAQVIHNGFAPGLTARLAPPSSLASLAPSSLKVAMVGSLSPMKGVFEFVEAARILAEKGLEIDFILVGDEIRTLRGLYGWLLQQFGFARPVREELKRFVHDHRLEQRVRFLGFTTEIKAIYDAIDLICFPSQLDAPGRPIFEAAFSGVPAIVALRDPRPDTMIDGETGICIPARDPQALADAIEGLYHDRDRMRRLGEQARRLTLRNFNARANAFKVLEIYRLVAEQGASGGT